MTQQATAKRVMTQRVIQYATGNVGRMAMQMVVDHPLLELVGLGVTGPAKVGKDAGELLGAGPLGVVATDDLDALCALDADVVLHMPLPSAQVGDDPQLDEKVMRRFLEAGKNVITTVGYLYPKAYGADVVARLEAACAAGGTSVHGTGANPGFMSELLPLTLSSMSATIERIYVLENTEFSRYPSPEIICGMLGFGRQPDEFEQSSARYRSWLTGLFAEAVWMVADGLDLPLDEVVPTFEYDVADAAFDIAAGPIAAGTVASQRWLWEGMVAGRAVIALEAIYRARGDQGRQWGSDHACVVRIDGTPRFNLELANGWIGNGLLATAAHAVNAIPHVVAAAPGIRTFLDLPLITGRRLVRS